jgi:pimeloyl-ACP methyl ester carboxylesterase
MATAETSITQYTDAKNGVRYAYRRFGKTESIPLVFYIHFRGNMDFWDPLLINPLAERREVILFDNAGVGRSTGSVPTTFAGWATDSIAFIRSLGLQKVDLLGFSMGGLAGKNIQTFRVAPLTRRVALEAALAAPELVRKLVIAGSRAAVPSAEHVSGIVWPQEQPPSEPTTRLVSAISLEEGRDALKYSCFPDSEAAQSAFDKYWSRIGARSAEAPQLSLLPMEPNGANQIAAIIDASTPQANSSYDRLGELKIPVLVMNGDSDTLVPTSRSWELLVNIKNSQLIIYPRSGHGFLWQYAKRVAEDTTRFLDGTDLE